MCAKLGGMHVDRFSVIGIGPVIWKMFTWRGTEFVISAIPFGAYVHIVGMEPEEYAMDEQGNLPPPPAGYRNFREQSAVGPIVGESRADRAANYIAAMVLVIIAVSAVGLKEPVGVEVSAFNYGSPAAAAGIQVGDEILSIDGEPVSGPDFRQSVVDLTADKLGTTVQIAVARPSESGEFEEITYPVKLNAEAPALNASLANKGDYIPVSPVKAIAYGIEWPFAKTREQLIGLWSLVTGSVEAKVGGPVAIAKAIKVSADKGFVDLLVFSALISTVLGLFNLLPLPAPRRRSHDLSVLRDDRPAPAQQGARGAPPHDRDDRAARAHRVGNRQTMCGPRKS